ncbi:MAG: hypothetical protein JNJ45_00695 [Chthonomonas sp.]|nr:hypothetical protein [Chthonomonas sp.]
MAHDDEALAFIANAKSQAVPDESILVLLEDSGWPRKEASRVLARHYAESKGLAAPRSRRSQGSFGVDICLNVLACLFLITTLVGLIIVLSGMVDTALPMEARRQGYDRLNLEYLGSVIVGAPLYLWVMKVLNRRLATGVSQPNAPFRQWIVGLLLAFGIATVFYRTVILVIDAIMGRGDLANSFAKLLITALLVGLATWYYSYWLRAPFAGSEVNHEKS